MGKIWFTNYPQVSATFDDLRILRPRLLRGWWSYDAHGNKKYGTGDDRTRQELGTKMYFHVEVGDIKEGDTLHMQLYDLDAFFDTSEFPDDPVTKEATVKRVNDELIASVGVDLRDSWESVVADDIGPLELYWEVAHTAPNGHKISESLPFEEEDYLQVTYTSRTLYIKPPVYEHRLPEILAWNGNPLIFLTKAAIGSLKDKATGNLKLNGLIDAIVFAKLEKGDVLASNGKVYNNRKIYSKDIYTNEGVLHKNVKRGHDIGNKTMSSKAISQYDYIAKNSIRIRLLGKVAKVADHIFNLFDLIDFTLETDHDKAPVIPFGPLSILSSITGMMLAESESDYKMWEEQTVIQDLEEAKVKGLDAVRDFIDSWDHHDDYQWALMAISSETATKLVQGGFKTFDEFTDYSEINPGDKIEMLYRIDEKSNEYKDLFIIETLFIDEI